MSQRFHCAICDQDFESDFPEAEAVEERVRIWGEEYRDAKIGPGPDDLAIVCDDCWKANGMDTIT